MLSHQIIICPLGVLADFLGYRASKRYLQDTVVVVAGDHHSMPDVAQGAMH
jgi:phosphoglycerol transferase MdoB-like AlkP superfamily enzyme